MNRSYKYTIATLFLAAVFAFGSMEGMSLILRAKERQFLSERGSVTVEAPVRAWQEADDSMEKEAKDQPVSKEYALTAEQMAEVLSKWDGHMAVIHSPVNGQISMEEAMEAGEKWLADMGFTESGEEEAHSMYARLFAARQKEEAQEQLEPYYSFWFVQYFSQSKMAFLYINAVTGKVWNADVTFYEALPEEIPYEKLTLFAELAGLQVSDTGTVVKDKEGRQAVFMAESSPLCAEMKLYRPQPGPFYMLYGEEELTEHIDQTSDREKAGLTFKLAVSKER